MTYAQPGPLDCSLLHLQDNYISNQVWEDQERIIRPRYTFVWAFTHLDQIDNWVKNLINLAGFGHIINVGKVDINQHLVSALVERWRMETHTFHFRHGGATITLQDVALQLGLKIDGLSVTGFITSDVRVDCQTLLEETPPDKYVKSKMIYLTWLRQNFQQLPVDADDVVIAQHARAHMMMIISGCLMPDTSGARVHFIWGAVVLASLFRALDRAVKPDQTKIGGCLLLLQSWAWDRIKCITPKIDHLSMEEVQEGLGFPLARRWSHPRTEPNIPTNSVRLIRIIFDKLHINEFLWTPYDTPEIRPLINDEEYYPGHHQHQSYAEPNVPPVHVPRFMSQHHPSQAQYQSTSFSGHASQGCQQSFQPLGFSSYIPQYSFQVPSTSNVFDGSSQMFVTTFNTPPSAYNLAPSSFCYRPSLSTQIRDMSHEDEDKDEDNNNNNDDDDDGDGVDDDDNGGHHVPQQQWTITRQHPRTRGDRGCRPREQQTQTNSIQQDEIPRRISRRTSCGTSSHY
ncbi:Protein MAIN-LIKE 2 [Glycine soja]